MAKPLPTQITFANVAPPWSLTNLDSDLSTLWSATNDIGTYSNTLVDTGSVNSIVVSPASGLTLTLFTGLTFEVLVLNTNTTTTPTLNANGTGAKTVINADGSAVSIGGIVAGGIYRVAYDGTNYRLLTTPIPAAVKGSWTSTLSGPWTAGNNVSGTLNYSVTQGTHVSIWTISSITQTATAGTSISMSGLPAILQPASGFRGCLCMNVSSNGSGCTGAAQVNLTVGTITLTPMTALLSGAGTVLTSSSFNSGTCGINPGWSINYSL